MTNKNYTINLKGTFIVLLLLLSTLNFAFANQGTKQFVVNLYGHLLTFNWEGDYYAQRETCLTEYQLNSEVNKLLALTQLDSLIQQMNAHAQELHMDDMAFLRLMDKVVNELLPASSDETRTLFKYAILNKKGFDVFLGYSINSLTLYGRTNFLVDNCLYIDRGNKKYYDLSFSQQKEPKLEQLFVIRHEGRSMPILMDMINPPSFNAKQNKKVIPFEFDGFVYFFTIKANQSLVDYYKELPTMNINTLYLNYGLSETATNSLVKELKEATSTMNKSTSIAFMLNFVQNSFEYKKDEEVYGQEKFSFPEETLMNQYADCEDKAMLYAVLLNKVLGLKTVALYYKESEHINIAIETWNKNVKSSFTFNNKGYVVCEPSGRGFGIGETATQVQLASLIDW